MEKIIAFLAVFWLLGAMGFFVFDLFTGFRLNDEAKAIIGPYQLEFDF